MHMLNWVVSTFSLIVVLSIFFENILVGYKKMRLCYSLKHQAYFVADSILISNFTIFYAPVIFNGGWGVGAYSITAVHMYVRPILSRTQMVVISFEKIGILD